MRASCGWDGTDFKSVGDECGIMQCGGKVVRNARSDGHTIHGTPTLNRPFVGSALWPRKSFVRHKSTDVDWSGRPHVGLTEFAVLVSGFQNAVGRRLWAEIFSNWSASGIISGVIWDVSRLPSC